MTGVTVHAVIIHATLFLVLVFVANKLRALLPLFLSLLLLLAAANLGYTLFSYDEASSQSIAHSNTDTLELKKTPSIYILVADGYQNKEGLRLKGLDELYIGSDLSGKGFTIYENAYSNYKPTIPSMSSFFNIQHHFHQQDPDRMAIMAGKNKLYTTLKDNNYQTNIVHPSDFLLRGECHSDLCYPSPSIFGQIGYVLAETIYYQTDFAKRTDVGQSKYIKDLNRILKQSAAPLVIYSHQIMPSHGPRGCTDSNAALDKYEDGLIDANKWNQHYSEPD